MRSGMAGDVYVMRVVGQPVMCKVGRTQRSIGSRFPKGKYRDVRVELYMMHRFADCVLAEAEIHSLLAWCRTGREELFQIEPSGAWGAVLWYAGEQVINPAPARRELRLFRTREKELAQMDKHVSPWMRHA